MNSPEIMKLADPRQAEQISNLIEKVGVFRPDFAHLVREIVNRKRFALIIVEAEAALVIDRGIGGDPVGELDRECVPMAAVRDGPRRSFARGAGAAK